MSRESKLVKNTFVIAIGTFLPKLASFVTLPILTGCLSKTEYGIYDLIIVLVSLLLPTVTLQVQTAAFRFLIDVRNDESEQKKIISTIFCFIAPMSLMALFVLFFSLSKVPTQIRVFICLYFLSDIFVNAARQVCRGLDQTLFYSISAIISAVCKMLFTYIFVFRLHQNLLGTTIALFVASFCSLLYLVVRGKLYTYVQLSCFDRSKLKELLKYSWPMVPNSISGWVMRVSDRIVVTAFLGVSVNAVYAVANKIPSLLNLAQNTFTMAWQENASMVSKDEDASEYYSFMFRTMLDLLAGFFGILIGATPLLYRLFIRGDYSDSYFQIPILFLAMFFYSLSTFIGGIYVAYKRSDSVGITTAAAALINIVVDVSTIKWIGLYAASGSTLFSYLLLFIFRVIDIQKIVVVQYNIKHLFTVIVFVLVESVFCYMSIPSLNLANIIIGVILAICLNRQTINALRSKLKKHG